NSYGRWVTRSSVIADATQDDAATTAKVNPWGNSEWRPTFTENAASGRLLFTDATTNSAFALVPQVTVPPQSTQKLRFSASYDNTVLNLPAGTRVRAEILMSFGNAGFHWGCGEDIDINGNGIVDPDEQYVRSVSERIRLTVPAQTPGNGTVTLTDTVADITTTGTVTFTNPVINIIGTQATVTVDYNGGASGGTITNCAHLAGAGQMVNVDGDVFPNIAPIDLTACDTQTVGPYTCVPGTLGCGWDDGQIVTYTQIGWGDPAAGPGMLLNTRYDFVYGSTGGLLEIGLAGTAGFSILFTSASAVLDYEPAQGAIGALNADLVDPTASASGAFGGEVLALRLNVDFGDAGEIPGSTGLRFGDLTLCRFTTLPALEGMRVRDFLAMANTALGGGSTPVSIANLFTVTEQLNAAFENGSPTPFAQNQLFNGACP
ncbi:MAG TPA: hypothetical protein VK427_19235, partial [Kofleriaceae bacterium]|nr:hypothetical protein [Kofleriaceae bacterium]